MKVKALSLIFLVVFAAVATSVVLCLSTSQAAKGSNNFAKSYNIVQVGNETGVEPNGEEIDNPGLPT